MDGDSAVQNAHLILLNICTIINLLCVSIYTAVSFPLGTTLGAGKYVNARKLSLTALMVSVIFAVVVALVL